MKPSTKKSVKKANAGSGLEAFTPDSHNSNRGTLRGAGFLEQSLRKFGAGRSIFVDKNGKIIGGNKTHQQALELGMGAQVVDTDGNTLVVVRRNDIDLDTPKGREMAIADNRVGEINLEWVGEELLGLKDEGVDVGSWFFDNELAGVLADGVSPTDPTTEWKGMPEFTENDARAFRSIVCHFVDQAALDKFVKDTKCKITDKSRYLWFPEIEKTASGIFKER